MSSLITKVRLKQIEALLEKGKRLDDRGLHDYREIKIEQGVIEKAEGSATRFLGKTEVLVGVKVETGEPFPDTPNEGVMTVNAELVPLASPTLSQDHQTKTASNSPASLTAASRESHAIDTEKLCIEPGKKVFVVFVDVYVLNHDGNLIDASALAAMAALMNTKMPNYEIKDGELKMKQGYTPLPMKSHPITVTIGKINNKLLVDPWLEEEQVMDARITIGNQRRRQHLRYSKGRLRLFHTTTDFRSLEDCQEKAVELRKKLNW